MSNMKSFEIHKDKIKNATKNIREFLDIFIDEFSLVETDPYLSSNTFFDSIESLGEGVLTGTASVNGKNVAIIAENSNVLGGSLSKAQAKKIMKIIDLAVDRSLPIVSVLDSCGARISEGLAVLEGYSQIISALIDAKNYVPHLCIIKGNAVGLNAAIAETADFVLIGDNGVMSLNPPKSVIANSGKNTAACDVLGKTSISSNSLLVTHIYNDNADLKNKISTLLEYSLETVVEHSDDPNRTTASLNKNATNSHVLKALIDKNSDIEFYSSYETGVYTGLATINNVVVGIVATNFDENSSKLSLGQIKKIKRFVKIISSFDIPLVTLVDSEGVQTCLTCEQQGIVLTMSKLLNAITNSSNNKIAVITGNAIGVSYVALASKGMGFNTTYAFPDAFISPVTEDVAIDVLENSNEYSEAKDPLKLREKLKEKYAKEFANPFVSLKDGYVDDIIEPALVRPYVANALQIMFEEN